MTAQLTIPARFNGPPTSGNGGYSCGVIAAHIQGAARVRLHIPPPLDTPMTVKELTDGGVELYAQDTLVGSGSPATLDIDIPPSPGIAAATQAMAHYPARHDHLFPTCFVCGPGRPAHDGLELYPGAVDDEGLMACTWQAAPDLRDDAGDIREEILWSALDCPGYFAAMRGEPVPAVLGELVGNLHRRVAGDQALVVFAWPLGQDGRKYYAGTAIATTDGEVVASAHSTWIELKG